VRGDARGFGEPPKPTPRNSVAADSAMTAPRPNRGKRSGTACGCGSSRNIFFTIRK